MISRTISLSLFSFYILINYVECLGGPKGFYSNEWLLKTTAGKSRAGSLANDEGFEIIHETSDGYFILRNKQLKAPSRVPDSRTIAVPFDAKDETFIQLRYLNRTTKAAVGKTIIFNDSFWSNMWHVQTDTFPSNGVYDTWVRGYSGEGIHVSVLDDGVEPDHPDLVQNYILSGSYDYLMDQNYVNHTEDDFHGTWCAGIVSAVKNDFCVAGMAYQSTFGAVKIFDTYYGLTDFGEGLALTHNLVNTDIYSNSWGPIDDGERFEAPGPLAMNGLKTAITEGRNGLGAIYTWAAGNGGIYDDCNCDGYASSIYTISVTSIGRDQGPSWYSEECTSILAGTYSGDSPDLRIATTDTGGSCTTIFQGTSASCPMGAGIIALVLEANPNLSWRDMQHLIVETSVTEGLIGANWQTNGAGMRVSHAFGFGMMNAAGMVDAALSWQSVPEQIVCESGDMIVNSMSDNGVYVVEEHRSDGCMNKVRFLEHVEVEMIFQTTYRGSMEITLTSPSGTKSRLLRPRRFDAFDGTTEWTFMTVHNWGEFASGIWRLQLESTDSSTVFILDSWKLKLYGTQTATPNNPLRSVSEDSDDTDLVGPVVGAAFGGAALATLVAGSVYFFVLKKAAKGPSISPTTSNGPANISYQ